MKRIITGREIWEKLDKIEIKCAKDEWKFGQMADIRYIEINYVIDLLKKVSVEKELQKLVKKLK